MSRRIIALAVALTAAGTASANNPAKVAIMPGSDRAALILKTDLLPIAPGMRTSYRMTLQSYDPAGERLRGAPYGGLAVFAARPKEFVDGHLVLDVKPGTYVFKDFSMQDRWSLCFNGGTRSFTVKPGEILYLGALDARGHMAELQTKTAMSGQTVIRGHGFVSFFDGVTPPLVTPPTRQNWLPPPRGLQRTFPRAKPRSQLRPTMRPGSVPETICSACSASAVATTPRARNLAQIRPWIASREAAARQLRLEAVATFSATAARTSALKPSESISTPSLMSMARIVLPPMLPLNSPAGSGSLAPFAKVSFT